MKLDVKTVLLASTLLSVSAPAWAQTTPDAACVPGDGVNCGVEANGAPAGNEIVVTGSRIARPEAESGSPITVVDSTQILQDGAANVSDILNELPQVGIGSTRTNSNFLTSGTGIATINLRSLGDNRTLTLVNGRRFISGYAGSSAVDVNNIPVDMIEKVDVVTGGSSAVYGSDAIAGVTNFVLRSSFEGIKVRAQSTLTDEADNGRYLVSVLAGTKFGADDRGNAILSFQYDKDRGLASRNRSISSQDCFDLVCGPAAYSSFGPQGQFQLSGLAPDASGDLARQGQDVLPGGNSNFSFNPDNSIAYLPGYAAGQYGFNRNGVRYIATPVERYLANGIFNYDLTDGVELYAEASYSRITSNSSLEASALQNSDIYGSNSVGIPITNAFIPTSVAAAIAAANSDADPTNNVDTLLFRRRQNDVFNRSNTVKRDTWRAVLGARGDLGSNISYDVSYVYGHLNDYNASEDIDNARYRNALDSIRVGTGNALGTDIVCRNEAARAEGCIPIDLFGYNTVDPRAAAYVQAVVPKSEEITNEQHVVTASLSSSSLIDLWGAGGIGAAIGVEYRYDSTVDDLDILTNTGGNSGNQTPDLRGHQDVREVFGEVSVPLITDKPFFRSLRAEGAIRYSDYSTIGSVLSWNAGAQWEPLAGLSFRGRYAVSNRAPNNNELFSAPSETFAAITDPCNGITANSTGATDAACRAIPGIANFFAANPGGTFEYTLADLQGVNGFVGGNPNLQEETAKTITAGVVVNPRSVPGLLLTVDYYDITIDDAINTIGRSYTVQQCLLTDSPLYCDNVIRGQNGLLETVNAQLINIAGYESRGVDVMLSYARPVGLVTGDRFSLKVDYTYVIDFKTQSDPASNPVQNAGTFGPAYSTHRGQARATYAVNGSTISWQTTFLSGEPYLNLDENFVSNDPDVLALNDIDDYWLHSVQLSQNVGDRFTFYFNVDNVFDTKPQYLPGSPYGTPTGLETSDAFDLFGRRFTAGFTARF